MAVGRAELIMQEWKEFIAAACKKDTGEIVDAQEVIKSAEAKIASFNDHCKGIAAVAGDLLINLGFMDPAERPEKLLVLGQAAGKATPILKHLDDRLSETKYVKARETECRSYFEKPFSKQFNIGRRWVLMT